MIKATADFLKFQISLLPLRLAKYLHQTYPKMARIIEPTGTMMAMTTLYSLF